MYRLQLCAPCVSRCRNIVFGGVLGAVALFGGGQLAKGQAATAPVLGSAGQPGAPSVPRVTLSLPTLFATALKTQVNNALALGRTPLLELSTPWCVPCQAFDASLSDPQMREALRGTLLIRINVDEWEDTFLTSQQLTIDSAIFALVPFDTSGQPGGPTLTTQAWSAARPAVMAPILQQFVIALRRLITPATPTALPPSTSAPSGQADTVPVVTLTKSRIFNAALQAEVSKAVALGRVPIMEIGEVGCGACEVFEQHFRTGDPLGNTYLIHVDGLDWNQVFDELGFTMHTAYPTIYSLDGRGRPVNHITGTPETAEEWRKAKQRLIGSLHAQADSGNVTSPASGDAGGGSPDHDEGVGNG